MKKQFFLLLALATGLTSCHNKASDSIIGTWQADKVNVQFDEQRNTPELVKQIGEMEKQNSFVITSDSLLTFKSLDGETQGRLNLNKEGMMHVDGALFGQWENGQIVTRTDSPLGEVVVTYKKRR